LRLSQNIEKAVRGLLHWGIEMHERSAAGKVQSTWNESSREWKFHRTNGPGNKCSRERIILRTKVPGNERPRERTVQGTNSLGNEYSWYPISLLLLLLLREPASATAAGRLFQTGIVRWTIEYLKRFVHARFSLNLWQWAALVRMSATSNPTTSPFMAL